MAQAVFSSIQITPNTCLLLDEPESGQDFDHVLKLKKAMLDAAARGAQIICASHHVLFWQHAHIIELDRNYKTRVIQKMCAIVCAPHQEKENFCISTK